MAALYYGLSDVAVVSHGRHAAIRPAAGPAPVRSRPRGVGAGDREGYEGLVAKDPASKYVAGRTLQWFKVKHPQYRVGERGWEPTR